MSDPQPVAEQRSQKLRISRILQNSPQKTKLAEKFKLLERKGFLPPWPTPIHKLSMTSMVWNISPGQLGCLPGCASSQLLHACSLAGHGELETKSLISWQQLKTSVLSAFFLD